MVFREKKESGGNVEDPANVLLVATMDTKGKEVLYLQACLKEFGIPVLTLDVGILGEPQLPATVTREEIARAGGMALTDVRSLGHEGKAIAIMTKGAIQYAWKLYNEGKIKGIIGLGGVIGTSLATGVMRAFPIGVPKLMISTMASRDTRPFVGTKDILMLHSVCNVSGINRITGKILRNGALAMMGMLKDTGSFIAPEQPLVLLSTLGTTATCARIIRQALENEGKEVIVFHTGGSGGEAMEEMVLAETVEAVIDLSLHEIADYCFGGDYQAGSDRGKAALQKGIPTVIVPGNIDFLVTGSLATAQQKFPNRLYHVRSAAVTAVRTRKRELETIGDRLAEFCNDARGPLAILVPMEGFSAFDAKGGPFYDPEAVQHFTRNLKKELDPQISLEMLPFHINDPRFAGAVLDALGTLLKKKA